MSARAAMKTGDLNRLLKAAKAHGFMVEIRGDTVRLLPTAPSAALPSEQPDSDWDKALGLSTWPRSA